MKTIIKFVKLVTFSLVLILIIFTFTNVKQDQKQESVKNENALMIGTYKKIQDSFNRIYVQIYESNILVFERSYNTQSDDLVILEDECYENLVFVDLELEIKKYTADLGIELWSKKSIGNKIIVQTEYINLNYYSKKVLINDCGLYAINIPSLPDSYVEVSHVYIYINYSYRMRKEN